MTDRDHRDSDVLGKYTAPTAPVANSQPPARTLGELYDRHRREIEELQGQVTAACVARMDELSAAYQRIDELETALRKIHAHLAELARIEEEEESLEPFPAESAPHDATTAG